MGEVEQGKIMLCKCQHQFQDRKFGKGKRWHNKCRVEKTYRCTVCGDVKTTGTV